MIAYTMLLESSESGLHDPLDTIDLTHLPVSPCTLMDC